jgi:hypothetical protein
MEVLDPSQDFSMHTPVFASHTGPGIKRAKPLQGGEAAFCRAVAFLNG